MKSLEFISYNIEVGKKLDDIVTWISNLHAQPDVFCFQEFPKDEISGFEQLLQKKGYNYVYTPGPVIYGIQVGQLTAHKKKTLQLIKSKSVNLGNHIWEDKYFKIRGSRSALVSFYTFHDIPFAVVNLHLTVLALNAMRIKQLNIVTEALRAKSDHVVIMGDFNYSSLLGVKRLVKSMNDAGFARVGTKMTTHKLFNHIPQQLDYVFQKGFVPQEINVLTVPHSDHLPVYTKLAILSK